MSTILAFLFSVARGMFRSQADLALENAALRQQLGTYLRRDKRPKLRPVDRGLWVVLRRVWTKWRSSLAIVKPATVLGWHRQGFRIFWRYKSRAKRIGRPPIPRAHIELIKGMSRENPSWGEDRIAEELRLKLGIEHSTSTVRKYMVRRPSPDGGQSWRRFVTNHSREVFACDFLVQYTARFEVVYVFVVMEVASRRIALINATRAPTLDWVKGQLREVASYGGGPSFLVHDNDGIFGQFGARSAERPYRCHLDLWLRETMGIRGVPTPYRAPNANARSNGLTGRCARRRWTTSSSSTKGTSDACVGSTSSFTTGLGHPRPSGESRIHIPSLSFHRRRPQVALSGYPYSGVFNTTTGLLRSFRGLWGSWRSEGPLISLKLRR